MSELIEFDTFAQVEVLLRAGMELKFEQSEGSEILNGSPIYASALNSLHEGLISVLCSSSTPGRAQNQADWYRLSHHRIDRGPLRKEVCCTRAGGIWMRSRRVNGSRRLQRHS